MRDAVDLIGKIITVESVEYTIVKVYFIPNAVDNNHNLYFGLTKINENTTINYSYYNLLPYIKKSINELRSNNI
jgi:hypothetical protein